MDKIYKVDTYIRVRYFKILGGALRYADKFKTTIKIVTDPQEIIWAKKQLKIAFNRPVEPRFLAKPYNIRG